MKPLRQRALDIYKKTALESWLVGLLSGLLITGIICLDFILPLMVVLTIPFLCLPILFAAHVSHMGLNYNGRLTFRGTIKQIFFYFKSPFYSSFGFFSSLLKSVIVFIATEIFLSFFGQQITYFINPGINDSIQALYDYMMDFSNTSVTDIETFFTMNDNALLIYMGIVVIPAFILAVAFFIYNIARNSIGIYLRMNIPNPDHGYIKMVINDTHRRNRMLMFKAWMSLNWPGIILFFLGSIGAAIALLFYTQDPVSILVGCIGGGVFLLSFFMPFYLCNMEALYEMFAPAYQRGAENVNRMIKEAAEVNARRAQEEKEYFDRVLKDIQNQQNQSEENENNDTDKQ